MLQIPALHHPEGRAHQPKRNLRQFYGAVLQRRRAEENSARERSAPRTGPSNSFSEELQNKNDEFIIFEADFQLRKVL